MKPVHTPTPCHTHDTDPVYRWMLEMQSCDGLEIHPCCIVGFADGEEIVETCEPEDADFFTVYGHCREGEVAAFEDFQTAEEARKFASRLLETCPHLQHHGLLDMTGGAP